MATKTKKQFTYFYDENYILLDTKLIFQVSTGKNGVS